MTTVAQPALIPSRGRAFHLEANTFIRNSVVGFVLVLTTVMHPVRCVSGETEQHPSLTSGTKRLVTVADAIEMTTLGDRLATSDGAVAQFSPDGGHFVVVLKRGNLTLNTNDYSLLLWKSDDLFDSHVPQVLLTMSSSSNRAAIQDVTWLADNETILFLGEHSGELHQLYAFNIHSRLLKKLTMHRTNLISYSTTPHGRTIAYTAEEPVQSIFDDRTRSQGFIVSSESSYSLSIGAKGGLSAYVQLFIQVQGDSAKRLVTEGGIPSCCGPNISISPDGNYIAMAVSPADIPASWKDYSDQFIHTASQWKVDRGKYSSLQTYVLVDTKSGRNHKLLDVPLNSNGWQLLWSPNSTSVVIGGAYLPLDPSAGYELASRQSSTFAVEVRVPTGEVTTITQSSEKLANWDATTDCVVFRADSGAAKNENQQKVTFCKDGNTWQHNTRVSYDVRPEIVLRQDMNHPPKLYAIDPQTKRTGLLLDLNPQFKDLRFARVEQIRWKGTDGKEEEGGLYYPIDYVPTKRYPLVIQTHDWSQDQFMINGPFTTAFAAQPLAGQGIMVLQTNQITSEFETPNEAKANVAMFEGAIDDLDQRKLIDRNRVGIIGFSRTCLHVKYALTHSTYRFAAASVTDGFDGGYLQYILALPSSSTFTQDVEGINGGPPFGESLESWVERSPGFTINKVRTPLRINALSSLSVLGEWEWFAALSRLGRPVEMVVIEDGSHILEKSRDREISQQGNVDWFCFWLKEEESPDPAKTEQYARWRELRKLEQR